MADENALLGDRIVEQAAHIDATEVNETRSGAPVTEVTEVTEVNEPRSGDQVTAVTGDRVNEAQGAVPANGFNRADALMAITQKYLRGEQVNRSPVEVVVTVAAGALHTEEEAEIGYVGESAIVGETARRLSCDAGVVEVKEDENGVPLSVGRKRRTIAGAIKRALLKRDTARGERFMRGVRRAGTARPSRTAGW